MNYGARVSGSLYPPVRRIGSHALAFGLALVLLNAQDAKGLSAGFIENRGQVDERVLYYAAGRGGTIYLTRDALVFELRGPDVRDGSDPLQTSWDGVRNGAPALPSAGLDSNTQTMSPGCAVWVRLEGAQTPTRVVARGELPGHRNFLQGNDPKAWRIGIPSYEDVMYDDLWPGVNLVLRCPNGYLEFQAVTADGSQPPSVEFSYEGADEVIERENGQVTVETAVGRIVQVRTSPGEGRFLLAQDDPTAGAAFGGGDPSTLLLGTFLGGSLGDFGQDLVLDTSGDFILVGRTQSSDFPTTPGVQDTLHGGGRDAYVAKLSGDGHELLWSTYLGGSDDDDGNTLRLDSEGNPIIIGLTLSSDFPTTPAAYDTSYNGGQGDVFVAKLSESGEALLWSTYFGGGDFDNAYGHFELDPDGNIILTGYTYSTDFPTTPAAYDTTYNGGTTDAFVAKFSSSGEELLVSTYLGGALRDSGFDLRLDSLGNIILRGDTSSPDFPATPGAYDETYNGGFYDVFVAQLSSNLDDLLWCTFLGGDESDQAGFGGGFELDSAGNPTFTGDTESSNFPTTPAAYDTSYSGGVQDAFVVKLSSTGDDLLWSTFLGGASDDRGRCLRLDPSGNPILTGSTTSADFPTTPAAFDTSYNGDYDVFVTQLSSSGDEVLWSSFLGGTGTDASNGLILDLSGDPVLTGSTLSSDFPTTPAAYDTSYNGGYDVFLTGVDVGGASAVPLPPVSSSGWGPAAPNPFAGRATIRYALAWEGKVRLRIFDITGRLVSVLFEGVQAVGTHEVTWDGRDAAGRRVAAGTYLVRADVGGQELRGKIVMIK